MNIINKIIQSLLILVVIEVSCSCTDERESYTVFYTPEKTVTFSVRVPGGGTAQTYALTDGDENEVSTIEILLFDKNGNYTHEPIYSNNIATDPTDSRMKTFTVKIPEGTYDMVVLGNSRQTLGNALGSINEGDPKTTVLSKLLLSNNNKWNAVPGSSGYIPIPMWGEITDITVSSSMSTSIPLTFARMLSKVDVALTTSTATSKFSLESVRLYNYNNKGAIAPDAANWNSLLGAVTAPSVPASAQKPSSPMASPLLYDGAAINTRGVSCTGEIYTFEATAGTASALLENTCLVIGGIYSGDTQATYYRIDIANDVKTEIGTTTTTYLPLLRNHHYKINIKDIKGMGFATPEDAFKSRPVNIEANVISWNDADVSDIVFDGQYMMAVSKGEFTLFRDVYTTSSTGNTLSVTTDYPAGWIVEKIIDTEGNDISSVTNSSTGWLSLSPDKGASDKTTKAQLLLKENTSAETRSGFIHLKAGRLTYIIKVNQNTNPDIGIFITDGSGNNIDVLQFTSTISDIERGVLPFPQKFKVSWVPASSELFFVKSTLNNNAFVFNPNLIFDNIPPSGSLNFGTKNYEIQPTAITTSDVDSNPFYERSSSILYSVSNDISVVNKSLILRHFVYNMLPVVDDFYLMNEEVKSFGVRSNTPFTVSIKSDPNRLLTLQTTSGGGNTSIKGTPVYFKIKPLYTLIDMNDIIVTIKSPKGLFPDTDVSLRVLNIAIQGESNSYLISPNYPRYIGIPVSRANKSMLGNQLYTDQAFTAELVWTDNSNKISPNSNIQAITTLGTGPSGYLLVKSGSATGNAVVAIKNTSGKILWSWHIWVTDYKPTSIGSNTFMDRNLGAIGNTPGEVGTKGLLYQWGRKDPFPGSSTINGITEPTIYSATGRTSIIKTVPTASNFANSVANPLTFYWKSGENSDWYGTSQNNSLWGPDRKSVYDPCPPGWRVPKNGVWTGLTLSNFKWDEATYGSTNASIGGFYPAAGARNSSSGGLINVGKQGNYWTATASSASGYAFYLYFNSGYVSPGNSWFRAYGFSVRCVADISNPLPKSK